MELDGVPLTVIPLPAVTLTPIDMWPNFGKINSNIYKDVVFTRFFMSMPAVTLTFDPKSQSAYLPIQVHLWTKLGEIPFMGFLRYGVHKVYRPHRLTHSLMDRQTRIQCAVGTISAMVAEAQKCYFFRIYPNIVSVLKQTCIISSAAETTAICTADESSLGVSSAAARKALTMWGMVSSDTARLWADSCDCDAALLFDLAATVDELISWVAADAARLHACC